jgi:hypothetical protein
VVWFSDLHYYQRLVISFAGCLLQDSSFFFFFFFFLRIRKMDFGGASKQEEGEHACYTLILLQEDLKSDGCGAFKKWVGRHFSPSYQQFLECFLELPLESHS